VPFPRNWTLSKNIFCKCLGNWGKPRHFRNCLVISGNAGFPQMPATYRRWIYRCLFIWTTLISVDKKKEVNLPTIRNRWNSIQDSQTDSISAAIATLMFLLKCFFFFKFYFSLFFQFPPVFISYFCLHLMTQDLKLTVLPNAMNLFSPKLKKSHPKSA